MNHRFHLFKRIDGGTFYGKDLRNKDIPLPLKRKPLSFRNKPVLFGMNIKKVPVFISPQVLQFQSTICPWPQHDTDLNKINHSAFGFIGKFSQVKSLVIISIINLKSHN